ncbi:mucin-5AC-like isoform X1 [Dreissena polymorpha]|uniref:mucin-5AC-like isoform X1 n=1 Tax=Dreissena polymorpha TaxID=45954 RepID=UPI0022644BBA|nr:mucin-5AC-like isoform X1 [Dreissena polymorpha]
MCSGARTDYKRNVWCRYADREPTISTQTFANWNAANDRCADQYDNPSSAAGYSGKKITNLAFTNIRREWTLHTANSSFSGPRMFAYITNGSKEIKFSSSSREDRKYFLCVGIRPTATTTASTTQASSPTPSSTNIPSTSTSSAPSPATNTTTAQVTVSTSSMFTYSTTGNTSTSAAPNEAFADSSRGSSTATTAAGVSVAVALAVAAVLIVVGLRKKGKLCLAITKGSKFESTDNNRDISLARIDSKPNASYPASTQNGSFPGPSSNPTYCEHHTKTGTSNELCTSADPDVDNETINGKLGLAESEVHSYFVLEKDGFEQQRHAITSVPTDVHDYFVLEKQQSAIGNENSGSKNELHANFVHAKQGCRSTHEMPSNEAYPYFVLEKQTTLNSTPINTAFSRDLAKDDTDMYQEIDSNDTYAAIDDSRDDNNDTDYTNKAFKHSRTDFSDNIYNHLNTAGDDYDHVGKVHN